MIHGRGYSRGESVRVLHPSTVTTRYGSGLSFDPPESDITVPRAAVVPRMSTESQTADRAPVVIGHMVVLPRGTVISPQDRVVVRGITYSVDGEISDYRHPTTGSTPGLVVNLKAVAG